jgi:iron complex outermembrane receptor protein
MFIRTVYLAKYLIINTFCFILVSYSLSAAQEKENFLDMSLQELLDFQVISGSMLRQSIEDAPAMIDIITEEQINDFDADNLYELLSFLPGVEMMETFFGRTVLQFRGIMNIHYNNKVLLMINESPIYEPVNGSYFLELIPINAIKQIEIIRGRGSTLYGTNAYSGVINITTKKGNDDNPSLSAKAGYGSFSTFNVNVSSGFKINEHSGFYFGAQIVNGDGYEFNVKEDEKGNSSTFDYPNNNIKLYLNYHDKNFCIDAGYMHQEKMVYGIVPVLDYKGMAERNMAFANVKYTRNFSDDFKSSLSVRYNIFEQPRGDIGFFPFAGFPGHDTSSVYMKYGGYNFNTELQFDYNYSKKLSNITGFVYKTAYSDEYQFLWDDDNTIHPFSAYLRTADSYTLSAYTQFLYKPLNALQTVAGLRVVKDNDIKDIFMSPRLGLIYSFYDNYSFRALYGQAFRIPCFFEKYVSTQNVLFGSVDLNPEKIQSYDIGLEGSFEKVRAGLNGFVTLTKDGITRVATNDTTSHGTKAAMYINAAKSTIYGIEFSLSSAVGNKGYSGFNLGWKTGKDNQTKEDLLYFANITSNAWLKYHLISSLSFTPNIQYIGERKGNSAKYGSYKLDPYLLLNLSAQYQHNNLSLIITIKNILNKDYTYPEFVRRNINETPGGPGTAFRISLKYQM